LFVPLLPGLFLVGGRLIGVASPLASFLRLGAAAAISIVLFYDKGGTARGVSAQRAALVRQGASALAGARHVAALDVGWVGAATDAEVVDLAGVTDERVARLPGGHTSKRLPETFLEQRDVDAVVLLMSGPDDRDLSRVRWSRVVEARVAKQAADLGFVLRATLPLLGTSERYLVLAPRNRP